MQVGPMHSQSDDAFFLSLGSASQSSGELELAEHLPLVKRYQDSERKAAVLPEGVLFRSLFPPFAPEAT